MFRDTEKELARLEAELLAEEEPEEAFPDEEPEDAPEEAYEDGPAPQISYRAYNADISDEDLDEYAEAVLAPEKRGLSGLLVALLCLLTLGLVALVVLFLRQEGYL